MKDAPKYSKIIPFRYFRASPIVEIPMHKSWSIGLGVWSSQAAKTTFPWSRHSPHHIGLWVGLDFFKWWLTPSVYFSTAKLKPGCLAQGLPPHIIPLGCTRSNRSKARQNPREDVKSCKTLSFLISIARHSMPFNPQLVQVYKNHFIGRFNYLPGVGNNTCHPMRCEISSFVN